METDIETSRGRIPAVAVRHAGHSLYAYATGAVVTLVYPATPGDEDALRISNYKASLRNGLLQALRRELLNGRSQCILRFDEQQRFRGFAVEQKFVASDRDASAVQRLADGLQELLAGGLRGTGLLGTALKVSHEPASDRRSDPGPMYA